MSGAVITRLSFAQLSEEQEAKIREMLRTHVTVKRITDVHRGVPAAQIRQIGTAMGLFWDPGTGRMEDTCPPLIRTGPRAGTAAAPTRSYRFFKPVLEPVPPTGRKDWRAARACADADPDLFSIDLDGDATEARKICQRCPVRGDCLEYALARPEYGVWGGASEAERRMIRRQRGHLRHKLGKSA